MLSFFFFTVKDRFGDRNDASSSGSSDSESDEDSEVVGTTLERTKTSLLFFRQ